jgi:hypothetical protein
VRQLTELLNKSNDFEDSLQYYAAKKQNLFGIITRNIKDYKIKDIVIQTSKEFVKINVELFEDSKHHRPEGPPK